VSEALISNSISHEQVLLRSRHDRWLQESDAAKNPKTTMILASNTLIPAVNGEFQWQYFRINYFGTTLLYFCNMLIMWWLQLGGHGVQAVINSITFN